MKKITLLLLFISIIIFNSCKEESNTVIPPTNLHSLVADSSQLLSINDFSVELLGNGQLQTGRWRNNDNSIGVIFSAGLWIGLQQDGSPRGDILWDGTYPSSNYTSLWDDKTLGVYFLDASISYDISDWPLNYGAPVASTGAPRVYGDAMCWSSLHSDTSLYSTFILAHPIENIRVTQALYAYKRADIASVIFIRYDLTNLSDQTWNDIYLGYYSDTDLYDSFQNRTGYDSSRGVTYTYCDSVYSLVTGFTFLETPDNKAVYSHRIMRKNNYYNPDFGEYGFTEPEQILYALHGLSNSGQPMINPVTGTETLFAFTGDPVSGTGWLDVKVDVRSMITTGPFSLYPDETKTVTIVWEVNDGTDLQDALQKMKNKIDLVRSEPDLWQFK